ncbi:MAG: phosphatidylserine/phosphatidylglycerophosphate/cardiolipin synthase family protein [Bdellovibrionia bacterium]
MTKPTAKFLIFALLLGSSAGAETKLFHDGGAKEPLGKVIENASKYLYMEWLSVACDSATEPFLKRMEEKAASGVTVRMIVNKTYSWLSYPCLRRLEKAGIEIVKAPTHSSYIVNDRDQLLIGSQSLARMFLNSTGTNGLDRDSMLYHDGTAARDAAREFALNWEENRSSSHESVEPVPRKVAHQSERCWFLAQKPGGAKRDIETSLLQLARGANKSIFLSGVKISERKDADTPSGRLLRTLKLKARGGLPVEYMGNGPEGGNGELTMVLNEWIQESPYRPVREGLRLLRDWDSRRTTAKHDKAYRDFLTEPNMTVWNYAGFLHYKIWSFDSESVFIGSANLHDESWNDYYESGVLCKDKKLARELEKKLALDRANSRAFGKSILN